MLHRRHLLAQAGLLAVAPLAPLAARAATDAAVGAPAPDFSATDLDGVTRRLADFRGRFVVLEWVNPGCPFVRKHYGGGNIPGLQKEFTARNVAWISVNSTETASGDYLTPPLLAAWQKSQSAAPTATLVDADGTIGHAYGARTTPHIFIVDPQGTLVYAGGIDSIASARPADIEKATNYVRQGLTEALAGRPIPAATTRPYGCSVKYKS